MHHSVSGYTAVTRLATSNMCFIVVNPWCVINQLSIQQGVATDDALLMLQLILSDILLTLHNVLEDT